jgi:hypothetical protein
MFHHTSEMRPGVHRRLMKRKVRMQEVLHLLRTKEKKEASQVAKATAVTAAIEATVLSAVNRATIAATVAKVMTEKAKAKAVAKVMTAEIVGDPRIGASVGTKRKTWIGPSVRMGVVKISMKKRQNCKCLEK